MINLNTTTPRYFVTAANASYISYAISFLLVGLAFIIHPYILTIIAAVFPLWFTIKPRFFLPVYSISLAAFWGSRNYGVSYVGFFDDAIAYMGQFQSMRYENIASLFNKFIERPSNNEIIYTLFNYTIRIFTSDEKVFAFLVYLLIASLISAAAVLVHRRYYMVMIALLFFGIGSFAGLEILHLWRSTIASLLFLISVMYYSKNRRVAVLIMLSACLVHLFAVFMALLFLLFQLNKYLQHKYILPAVIFLVFFAFSFFIDYLGFYLNLFSGKDVIYDYFYGTDIVSVGQWIKILILLLLYYLLKRNKLDYRSSFMVTCQGFLILSYITFSAIAFTRPL